jgi:hypothetical protein
MRALLMDLIGARESGTRPCACPIIATLTQAE